MSSHNLSKPAAKPARSGSFFPVPATFALLRAGVGRPCTPGRARHLSIVEIWLSLTNTTSRPRMRSTLFLGSMTLVVVVAIIADAGGAHFSA